MQLNDTQTNGLFKYVHLSLIKKIAKRTWVVAQYFHLRCSFNPEIVYIKTSVDNYEHEYGTQRPMKIVCSSMQALFNAYSTKHLSLAEQTLLLNEKRTL